MSKISKNVGIMNRLKFCIPSNILLTLYNSFVLPYLNYMYSIITWGGGSTAYCNSHRDHTAPLFANLRLLKFNDLYHLNLGKCMYKYMKDALPRCFSSCF